MLGTVKGHGASVFLARHSNGQTAQQQSGADAMFGDDDFGIVAQRILDHFLADLTGPYDRFDAN